MLLRFGSSSELVALITRLESMDTLLSKWYGKAEFCVDFRDEALDVLQRLYNSFAIGTDAHTELMAAFRDPSESGALIYYFRVSVPVHTDPDQADRSQHHLSVR